MAEPTTIHKHTEDLTHNQKVSAADTKQDLQKPATNSEIHRETSAKQPLESISGEIIHITYHDPDSAFTVAKLKCQGKPQIAVVGHMPFVQAGHELRCLGSWVIDPRYGRQFSVERFSYELPSDPAAIERLLASGFLKGVGASSAAKIVKYFGSDTFKMLEETPERLFEVEGLGKKRIEKILRSWNERTKLHELFILLCSWGISQKMSLKILRLWGHDALAMIKKNPYQLAREIDGIGFQVADNIAMKLGIDPHSPFRIEAAINYFLWELSQEGHTCYPLTLFVTLASQKLSAEPELIEGSLSSQSAQETVCLFKPQTDASLFIATKSLYSLEQNIAEHIRRIKTSPCSLRAVDTEKAVAWSEDILHIHFAEKQKKAIICALENKCCVITGGPGTGKSTITRAIVFIYKKLSKKIILAAPTGKAAKRLNEITGTYSQTIHRLLKADPMTGKFFHCKEEPLSCDLLIIDEASMVDTYLAHALLDATPSHAKVIIIGDADQLPSVGPGTVLKDIIASETIPTVTLTDIYRQARHSSIIESAHLINKGFMPRLTNSEDGDFLYIAAKEPEDIRQEVLKYVTRTLPTEFHFDPKKDIQVLSPMRKGSCGIEQLNTDLQEYFSTSSVRKWRFALGDKVIQRKNNYQKEVFNGDVGFIGSLDEDSLTVFYDEKAVTYNEEETDELSLAWAVSVHKFQGSECPCVVIPIHTQHYKLLTRNLLYTAVTRGKKLVILIGSAKAIAIAVHQKSNEVRWTNLKSVLDPQTR